MKRTYQEPQPTPLQRAKHWCHWHVWDVFGDCLPGMPDWILTAHDDGTIMAHTDTVHPFQVGRWCHMADGQLIIYIEHEYPVTGIQDHD